MIKEVEFGPADVIASFLNFIAYLISPILFIWAVNTLFECNIPMAFKTWLAGLVLIMLLRFHLRRSESSHEGYYDDEFYDEDEDEDDDDYFYEDSKERKARLKARLAAYQNHRNKKNSHSDES